MWMTLYNYCIYICCIHISNINIDILKLPNIKIIGDDRSKGKAKSGIGQGGDGDIDDETKGDEKLKIDKHGNKVDGDGIPIETPNISNWTGKPFSALKEYWMHFQIYGKKYWKRHKSNNKIEKYWGAHHGQGSNTVKNICKILAYLDSMGLLDEDNNFGDGMSVNDALLDKFHLNATQLFKVVKYIPFVVRINHCNCRNYYINCDNCDNFDRNCGNLQDIYIHNQYS